MLCCDPTAWPLTFTPHINISLWCQHGDPIATRSWSMHCPAFLRRQAQLLWSHAVVWTPAYCLKQGREQRYAAVKLSYVDWKHICIHNCVECGHSAPMEVVWQIQSQALLKNLLSCGQAQRKCCVWTLFTLTMLENSEDFTRPEAIRNNFLNIFI